jgi:hypothetical protein
MTSFPDAALPVRGGFVLLDPVTRRPVPGGGVIPFQYNPDTLTRTLQPQAIGQGQPGDRLEALRLKGPPHESYKFDAEFDAAAAPERYPQGLNPVLAALELSVYPKLSALDAENAAAEQGMLEITPDEAPLTVLVLGPNRVLPVQVTDFGITEEAFDTTLNPIRAKVSIGVRVLTVDDLGFHHQGTDIYRVYHGGKETFASGLVHSVAELGNPSFR